MTRAALRIRRPDETHHRGPRAGTGRPLLLAERQGVAFVAMPHGAEAAPFAHRSWAMETGVVVIPASDEEIRASEIDPSPEAGFWQAVPQRPDLLAPALARLLSGDHGELVLQPGRDGLRAILMTSDGEEQPFPIAPKDALGFAAAVFAHAPRGVVRTAPAQNARVIVDVRPGRRRHEYRLSVSGLIKRPSPSSLSDIGLSSAMLELLLDSLDRHAAVLLVSGGATSGRSTTLALMAKTLAARGRRGGWIGLEPEESPEGILWLAEAITDWPFPDSLHAMAPDFVVVDPLRSPRDLALAARLASSGRLILAAAPAADAEALVRAAQKAMERGAAPSVPTLVLGQALSRTVCPRCRTRARLSATQTRRLGFHRRDVEMTEQSGGIIVARGRGCKACAGTGASGLTGVFEFFSDEDGSGSLPRMREEGWRKALQGTLVLEDVLTLSGAHRPMRTMREIQVHAGLSSMPADAPADPARIDARPDEVRGSGPGRIAPANPDAGAGSGAASREADALANLFRGVQSGRRQDPRILDDLIGSLCARAAGNERLGNMLVASRGFHLSRHSVNTTLIAVRLAGVLGIEGDPAETARPALLHDLGLLDANVEPGKELVPAVSEEVFDSSGCRLKPETALKRLGCDHPGLTATIIAVQTLLTFHREPQEANGRPDHRAQAIAMASLLDLTLHGPPRPQPFDVHDAASLIMEQHGRRFEPMIFRALLQTVPIFPIGCWVELSSGDRARVISLNAENHFRPRVELLNGSSKDGAPERRIVDLSRSPFLHIRQRVSAPAAAAGQR